jgi:hypothetical protein
MSMTYTVYVEGMDGDLYWSDDVRDEIEARDKADRLERFNGKPAYAIPLAEVTDDRGGIDEGKVREYIYTVLEV